MLVHRVLSAALLVPLVVAALLLGGYPFLALIGVAALAANFEFARMMRQIDHLPSIPFGLLLTAALVGAAYWPHSPITRFALVFIIMASLTWEVLRTHIKGQLIPQALSSWALMVVGAAYVGGLLGHFVSLRQLENGEYWVWLALLTTWVADSAAYFAGTQMGRHAFSPVISPKKTWEGTIAGLIAGTVTAALLGRLVAIPFVWGVPLGLLLSLAAVYGDLAESFIKRQVNVKDSGRLIPGHGGALDRIDSLLFVGTCVYYFQLWAPLG